MISTEAVLKSGVLTTVRMLWCCVTRVAWGVKEPSDQQQGYE